MPEGKATAVVGMERVQIAGGATPGGIEMQVDGSIYLGRPWQHRLSRGSLTLRAQGHEPLDTRTMWCSVAPEHIWIFAG